MVNPHLKMITYTFIIKAISMPVYVFIYVY